MSLYSTLYDEIEFSIERIWRFLPPRYKSREGGGGGKHYPIDLIFGLCYQDMLWMNWFNEQRDPRKMMKNETP